jgi:hypothetical protein
MLDRSRWSVCVTVLLLALCRNPHTPSGLTRRALNRCAGFCKVAFVVSAALLLMVGSALAENRTLNLPFIIKPSTGPDVAVSGRIVLQGRDNNAGAVLKVNGHHAGRTDSSGQFSFNYRLPTAASTTFTVTAEAPAYLWAQTVLTADRGLTFTLPDLCLYGGDVAGPDSVVITPTQGCPDTSPVQVAGLPDGQVNIIDITLVSTHQGISSDDPTWGPDPCHPEYVAYRADINGDGYVNTQDLAIVLGSAGFSAPLPWVSCPQ